MPLDWSAVKNKYGAGFHAPTCAGGKFLKVARAEHEAIYIDSPIWSAKLHQANLENGMALMEGGTISRDPGLFVEDDMLYVAVIVNEFGEVGNDGQMTMQDDDEQSIEFNSGCLAAPCAVI